MNAEGLGIGKKSLKAAWEFPNSPSLSLLSEGTLTFCISRAMLGEVCALASLEKGTLASLACLH